MNEGDVIRSVCSSLPADVQERIKKIEYFIRDRPLPVDLERGCHPKQVAYFYGVRGDDDVYGDGTNALPEDEVAGEIVVFRENLRPVTVQRLRDTLLHEIAHALGYDEEEIVSIMGYAPC